MAMDVLKLSSSPLHFTTKLSKSQFPKQCMQIPLFPSSSFSSINRSNRRFKLCATTFSTEETGNPFEVEAESERRFDWYAQWYPIMPICDLDKRVPQGKTVMGIDVVVWWDKNESGWKVFDDLCPHRLAPLSEGRIDQWGRLQCVHHGWCFNGSGDCKFIPQAPAPPDGPPVHTSKRACVSVYPSVVQNDILWFWPNSDPQYKDIMAKKTPPFIPELDDPSYTKLIISRDLPYGYEVLTENLMDPAHVPYAHYGIVSRQQTKHKKADREGGQPIEIVVRDLDVHGFISNQGLGHSKFVAPCVLYTSFNLPSKERNAKHQDNGTLSLGENNAVASKTSQRKRMAVFMCIPISPEQLNLGKRKKMAKKSEEKLDFVEQETLEMRTELKKLPAMEENMNYSREGVTTVELEGTPSGGMGSDATTEMMGGELKVERKNEDERAFDRSKFKKVEIPIFNGMDLDFWLFKADRYFKIHNLTKSEKMSVAIISFDGLALDWYRSQDERESFKSWDDLKQKMLTRFQTIRDGTLVGRFLTIKWETTVEEYRNRFDKYLAPVAFLQMVVLEGTFMNGLSPWLKTEVDVLEPCGLARMMKLGLKIENRKRVRNECGLISVYGRVTTADNKREGLSKRLTDAEFQARREKGLCFKCEEKYYDGHRCKAKEHKKLRMLVVRENGEEFEIIEEDGEEEAIDENPIEATTNYGVILGSGAAIKGKGICGKVEIMLGDWKVVDNFLPLELGGYEGRKVIIRGDPSLTKKGVSLKSMMKSWEGEDQGFLVECRVIEGNVTVATFYEEEDEPTVDTAIPLLLRKFEDVFEWPKTLPPKRGIEHHIHLKQGTNLVNVRSYCYAHQQQEEMERLVDEMLASGIILPSTSPYSSLVILVRKKDGSWLFCVDYRALNNINIPGKFPIPVIEELFDELNGANMFSKIDLKAGYHQIRMHQEDVEKTAFRTHEGHYDFLVMPFGLTNAPSTFQALTNAVFRPYMRRFVLVFFDDILVYNKGLEKHIQYLELVLEILKANELYANLGKCSFAKERVGYLGHIISEKGVEVDPKKIRAIREWPIPTNVREVRGFLGSTGYYVVANVAFEKLKTTMMTLPVLAKPDFNLPFEIETDASGYGVGAVLTQAKRPIAYFSCTLSLRDKAKPVYERELIVVVFACVIQPQYQKWIAKLLGYSFEVVCKLGLENTAADALSRLKEIKSVVGQEPEEFPNFTVHQGVLQFKGRTYKRITRELYWDGMKKNIKKYCEECLICQRNKTLALSPAGLLNPLEKPDTIWNDISVDFIDGLPKSAGYEVIFVVVDRMNCTSTRDPLYQIGIRVFVSHFWNELFKLAGTKLHRSSAYHPQTDGQLRLPLPLLYYGEMDTPNSTLDQQLKDRDIALGSLKEHLCIAQEKMKKQVDVKRRAVEFQVHQLEPYLSENHEWMMQSEEEYGYIKNPSTKDWEVLISWKGLPPHEATWEDCNDFKHQFPDFHLETRWIWRRKVVLDHRYYLLTIERKILDVGTANWQKACFLPTKSDAKVVAFRRWLNKYSDGHVGWRGKFSGILPPSPPKEQLMERYWSHVVNCSSCKVAYKGLNALEVVLQVISIASLGIFAATKQSLVSGAARVLMVAMAILSFASSRWLSHFIYKNFHFHDYNHAIR
ncbi:Ty3/gypsy retrotransposon protein [Cucumis melo var. makuwa]|uniref:Ty3/gypsy retrotransposon protein n=1 Tax=Cucumis melo var. makuwa TaxID=1194695 RepID=A0A5D3CFG5_CUCMM|nr:Ty3/gypsy retrotransposon protein [Cucumis melo var. makuwa]